MGVENERDELREAQRALARADWDQARRGFEAALATAANAQALEGLGLALWFLGRVGDGIAAREQAFEGYVASGDRSAAARVAVWVSHQHVIAGRRSAARGWLARAERALGDGDRCVGHGWVAVERANTAASAEDQVAGARLALEIARAEGDDELEVLALSVLGRGEVSAGRIDVGMALLDEAMAAASTGRVGNVHTLASAYCNLVVACTGVGDWERAHEWCELVDQFAVSHDAAPLLGSCRTFHADLLVATGRWPAAERALLSALTLHARYVPELAAPTVAALAMLRVRQGRLGEAARLLTGREEQPESLSALALLHVAEGQVGLAAALLERGLQACEDRVVPATGLLAALVEARLGAGEVEAARAAAERLQSIASTTGMRLAQARAELASARVALAGADPSSAAEPACRALAEFGALDMPLEGGEARLELARALRIDAVELAVEEARTALATFRGLGAARAADAAAALLRTLGSSTGRRPHLGEQLTAREDEVLDLITLGMSNARIARTLVISEKTAGHHVSRILTKLGLHNRAEAAAYAVRRG